MSNTVLVRKVTNLPNDMEYLIDNVDFTVAENDFVVIKPNLCDFRPPEEGGTTSPEIVEELIKIIKTKAKCVRIAIVESDHAVARADEEFERLGYGELAEKYGVELINLSNDAKHDMYIGGYYFDYLKVPETLLRMTKFISVAKLKTHTQQKITCIMKNQFGLLTIRSKSKYHAFMSEVLTDINSTFSPSLCIIDGLVGMEGPGPSDGLRRECGVIVCGTGFFSTDVAAAQLMGFSARSVPYLGFAEKKGIGKISEVNIVGDRNIGGKFEFIPGYIFRGYRFAFFIGRHGSKLGKFLEKSSEFLGQVYSGFYVIAKRYYATGAMTMLRQDVFKYGKGLILRRITVIKFKLHRIT
jgi:uncharacterized protein (DUF362 family)